MHLVVPEIEKYIEQFSSPQDKILNELWRETHLKAPMPQMISGNIQGQFLEMFSGLLKPKKILEIGTFTGYSAICLAKGLEESGLLYTIDINEELQTISQQYFIKTGQHSKIKQLIGDARKIIPALNEVFDLIFIDADKSSYCEYFDLTINKVRSGGFIIADNVLWSGKVIDEKKDKDTTAIHRYNQKIATDKRVKNIILSVRDGLNICQKL